MAGNINNLFGLREVYIINSQIPKTSLEEGRMNYFTHQKLDLTPINKFNHSFQ